MSERRAILTAVFAGVLDIACSNTPDVPYLPRVSFKLEPLISDLSSAIAEILFDARFLSGRRFYYDWHMIVEPDIALDTNLDRVVGNQLNVTHHILSQGKPESSEIRYKTDSIDLDLAHRFRLIWKNWQFTQVFLDNYPVWKN